MGISKDPVTKSPLSSVSMYLMNSSNYNSFNIKITYTFELYVVSRIVQYVL